MSDRIGSELGLVSWMMLIMFLITRHGASVVISAPDNVLRRYKTVDHVITLRDHLGGSWDHVQCDVTAAVSHPGVNTWLVISRSGVGTLRFSILRILQISSVLWTFEMLNC